jgi:hypothetical protein
LQTATPCPLKLERVRTWSFVFAGFMYPKNCSQDNPSLVKHTGIFLLAILNVCVYTDISVF